MAQKMVVDAKGVKTKSDLFEKMKKVAQDIVDCGINIEYYYGLAKEGRFGNELVSAGIHVYQLAMALEDKENNGERRDT